MADWLTSQKASKALGGGFALNLDLERDFRSESSQSELGILRIPRSCGGGRSTLMVEWG